MKNDYVSLISLAGYESIAMEAKAAISRKIDIALKSSGFFICVDHGVPEQIATLVFFLDEFDHEYDGNVY